MVSIQNIFFAVVVLLLVAILAIQISLLQKLNRNANMQYAGQFQNPYQFPTYQQQAMPMHNMQSMPQASMQSDFFKRSIAHAENVINGSMSIDEYASGNKPGSDIARAFMYLSGSERQSLVPALNYYQSDPFVYSEAEREFRASNIKTRIPLWLLIIQDSMKKTNHVTSENRESYIRVA